MERELVTFWQHELLSMCDGMRTIRKCVVSMGRRCLHGWRFAGLLHPVRCLGNTR